MLNWVLSVEFTLGISLMNWSWWGLLNWVSVRCVSKWIKWECEWMVIVVVKGEFESEWGVRMSCEELGGSIRWSWSEVEVAIQINWMEWLKENVEVCDECVGWMSVELRNDVWMSKEWRECYWKSEWWAISKDEVSGLRGCNGDENWECELWIGVSVWVIVRWVERGEWNQVNVIEVESVESVKGEKKWEGMIGRRGCVEKRSEDRIWKKGNEV